MVSGLGKENFGRCLSFADIKFNIIFESEGRLPNFRGPTLRGALGFSLKRTVCHIRNTSCRDCPVMQSCVYSTMFEGVAPPDRQIMRKYGNIPQPFVIIINQDEPNQVEMGQKYEFTIRLFGQSIHHVPYLSFAIMQAGEKGLGKDEIPFRVEQVTQAGYNGNLRILYDGTCNNILPGEPQILDADMFNIDSGNKMLQVKFETPVKYLFDGKPCRTPDFQPFLKAALRRVRLVTHFYGIDFADHCDPEELFKVSEQVELAAKHTNVHSFTRYSNRQNQKIPLEGMVGSVVYKGEFNKLYPLLQLANLTHVGKATSFGFGRISLQTV